MKVYFFVIPWDSIVISRVFSPSESFHFSSSKDGLYVIFAVLGSTSTSISRASILRGTAGKTKIPSVCASIALPSFTIGSIL